MRKIALLALICTILFALVNETKVSAASKAKRPAPGSKSSAVLRRMIAAQNRILLGKTQGSTSSPTGTASNKLSVLGSSQLILNYGSPLDQYVQYRSKYLRNPYSDYSILGIMGYGGYSDFNPYSFTGTSMFSSSP